MPDLLNDVTKKLLSRFTEFGIVERLFRLLHDKCLRRTDIWFVVVGTKNVTVYLVCSLSAQIFESTFCVETFFVFVLCPILNYATVKVDVI